MDSSVSVDPTDIQGLILRGYKMPVARHLGLSITDPDAARAFLGTLTDKDSSTVSITTAERWPEKPQYCVNLGITFAGLRALGLSADQLSSFPDEFRQGAVDRAHEVGDTGESAPQYWLPWLTEPGPDFVVSVFAQSADALESATKLLAEAWSPGCSERGRHDCASLPDNLVHFGYRDGLSQPTMEGVPLAGLPDSLPRAPLGQFLLGYPSQHPQYTYPVPQPDGLGHNGSFAAFRILEQDVHAFEQFLVAQESRTGMPRELIAAKLCGRWRNGVPLELSPETDQPDPPIRWDRLNDFDYIGKYDDEQGYRCPVGAHTRRMYPRGQRVAGDGSHLHRIVRRGMPYGPPYDPENPSDGESRGLLGMFIGVSLRDQFEFLMSEWCNDGRFTAGLGTTKDPIIGAHSGDWETFTIPHPGGEVVLNGLTRFVTTRGGAYCFLPSISAVRYLANLPDGA